MLYRYLVTQPDLNSHGTLHGGILMKWVDESCGMDAKVMTSKVCASRHIDSINFVSTARLGDIVEVNTQHIKTGKTSVTFSAEVTTIQGELIAQFDSITFVAVDKNHNPTIIGE